MGGLKIKAHLAAEVLIHLTPSTMNTFCKLAAGLALSGLCLTAHAQTTPMPQDRPMPEGKMADGKMKEGKMKGKMHKDKMGTGKMTKKEKMKGDKMEPKM
jgi:hypothetical protein